MTGESLAQIEDIKKVFEKYGITCAEDIWQVDNITQNALTILEEIREIIEGK